MRKREINARRKFFLNFLRKNGVHPFAFVRRYNVHKNKYDPKFSDFLYRYCNKRPDQIIAAAFIWCASVTIDWVILHNKYVYEYKKHFNRKKDENKSKNK